MINKLSNTLKGNYFTVFTAFVCLYKSCEVMCFYSAGNLLEDCQDMPKHVRQLNVSNSKS
jgi:hypothetical protein